MAETEFTASQKQAIETLDRDCIVTAGPGAGKTRVLVERILHILKQGRAGFDEIVAITFTKKAANEMKERVREEIERLSRQSKARADARRWTVLKRQCGFAAISTIHGFCASVLRAQPVEARVDPAFAILDEYSSLVLLTAAAEESLKSLIDERSETMARLIIGYGRQALIDELITLYEKTRALGLTLDEVEGRTRASLQPTSAYTEEVADVRQAASEILSLERLTPNQQRQVEEFEETWQKVQHRLPAAPSIENSPRLLDAVHCLGKVKLDRRGRLKDPVQTYRNHLTRTQEVYFDACLPETLATMMEALRRIDAHYVHAKVVRQSLDYEDLQWKTRELFTEYPALARQYASGTRFVLVDEFQDTNGLQKQIIDLLVAGRQPVTGSPAASDQRPATNLFIVGDSRQSIYEFRGAEVEVFDATAQELQQRGGETIELETNFRSAPELIDFFNAFFSRVMRIQLGDDEELVRRLGFVAYREGRPHRQSSEPRAVVELLFDVGEHVGSADEAREREADRFAARLLAMVQGGEKLIAECADDGTGTTRSVRYGDVAILFRALTDIKIYELALRRLGIPYVVVAGRGFYEREEIQDVLSLMRFLENRTNEMALVAALRSPLFGISDETLYWLRTSDLKSPTSDPEPEAPDHHPLLTRVFRHEEILPVREDQRALLQATAETLAYLLSLRDRIPLADLLTEILDATHYAALQATKYDGHQRVANLTKLIDLARVVQAGGPHFLTDFIHFIRQFTEMETRESEAQTDMGQQDVVQLMTIHKAKGLEFPVVVIPDLARQLSQRLDGILFDRELGLGLQVPDAHGRLQKPALRQRAVDHLRLREHFEDQRLLFVAMTRARDYLVLAGSAGSVKTRGSLREAAHWLEWLCTILAIDDVSALEETYDWEGIQLKVTPAVETTLERIRTRGTLVVDRHPEIRNAQPVAQPSVEPSGTLPAQVKRITQRIRSLPVTADGAGAILAVTRLLSLARCPRQYYFETVLGLPEMDQFEGEAVTDQPSTVSAETLPAAQRGKIIHSFCELYDGTQTPERVLEQALDRANLLEPEDRERALDDLRPLMKRYLSNSLYQEIAQQLQARSGQVRSEVDFIYRTKSVLLRGRMDKLLVDAGGQAAIIDFKSNRVRKSDVDAMAKEYELQMRIYALAARRIMKLEHVRAELYFIEPDVRYAVHVSDERGAAEEVEFFSDRARRARQKADFPPNPSPERCRRCRCFSFCPARAA